MAARPATRPVRERPAETRTASAGRSRPVARSGVVPDRLGRPPASTTSSSACRATRARPTTCRPPDRAVARRRPRQPMPADVEAAVQAPVRVRGLHPHRRSSRRPAGRPDGGGPRRRGRRHVVPRRPDPRDVRRRATTSRRSRISSAARSTATTRCCRRSRRSCPTGKKEARIELLREPEQTRRRPRRRAHLAGQGVFTPIEPRVADDPRARLRDARGGSRDARTGRPHRADDRRHPLAARGRRPAGDPRPDLLLPAVQLPDERGRLAVLRLPGLGRRPRGRPTRSPHRRPSSGSTGRSATRPGCGSSSSSPDGTST